MDHTQNNANIGVITKASPRDHNLQSPHVKCQLPSVSKPTIQKTNEGIVELQLASLELSEPSLNYLLSLPRRDFTLTWKFLDFDPSSTQTITKLNSHYNLDLSFAYKVSIDSSFHLRVTEQPLEFSIILGINEECLASGTLTINFDSSGKKYEIVHLKNPSEHLARIEKPYATLHVYYRLQEDPTSAIQTEQTLSPTESEYASFKEALDLVLARNKALRTTQSEISVELKDRVKWLHEESNWRRTLQEYTILCGEDPGGVQWRQWRDENTAGVQLRRYPSTDAAYEPVVGIVIERMELFANSDIYKNNEHEQFYVEYSFLSYEGPDMETKSQPKGLAVTYNFRKAFDVNLETKRKDCELLARMVSQKIPLRFTVVSEPFPDGSLWQTCEAVGECSVDIFALLQLEENENTDAYPISRIGKEGTIGHLVVTISGLQAMRRTALSILTPSSYDVIV